MNKQARYWMLTLAVLAAPAFGQADRDFDPLDPFAGVTAAADWSERFRKPGAVDPNDPFNNLTPGEMWRDTWGGQWRGAAAQGMSFSEFYDTLQGAGGDSYVIESPYPYTGAEEHWNAWRNAAEETTHTRTSLPDWSGDWSAGGGGPVMSGEALLRDVWDAVAPDFRPYFAQSIQAELEGRNWWPADTCLPNGYMRDGWRIRYFMMDPSLVVFVKEAPVTENRYVFTDGRGFLPPASALPQWLGESQGFWDGDELVIWTRNIKGWNGGHGLPEYTDQLEIIERWKRIGDELVADITLYDPLAFAYPWHDVSVYQRSAGLEGWHAAPPTLNECVSTNNVTHDAQGLIIELAPGDPGYLDLYDQRPWATVYEQAEAAKADGRLPAAESFLDTAPASPGATSEE